MESAKRTAWAGSPSGSSLENRLFFQAKNLAIEAMLLRIANELLRQGFKAHCTWKESSFNSTQVLITVENPKPTSRGWAEADCYLNLRRERIAAPEHLSDCYYSVESFHGNFNWGARTPALVRQFGDAVTALFASGYLSAQVERVNYPFDYQSHSPF